MKRKFLLLGVWLGIALAATLSVFESRAVYVERAYAKGAEGAEQKLRIFFTGSLNDKYVGCTCNKNPSPGLARRHTAVKKWRSRYPSALWLDTGDNVFGNSSSLQWPVLMRYWRTASYDALVLGDQEWNFLLDQTLGSDASRVTAKANSLADQMGSFLRDLSAIPSLKTGLRYKELVLPGREALYVKRRGVTIAVLGHAHKQIFRFARRGEAIADRSRKELRRLLRKARKGADIVVLISHSGLDRDKAVAELHPAPDVIISGHDQSLLAEPVRINSTIIVGSGPNGAYIGELVLHGDLRQGAKVRLSGYRMHLVDYGKTKPDAQVNQWIKGYRQKQERLFY
jgi:2',3'-cyclic-nucleotide 2'-phosphodiesterase (5'-nucleotidase family)